MLNVKVSGFPHPEISNKIAALTRGADCHHPRKAPATGLQSPLIMFTKINGSWAVRRSASRARRACNLISNRPLKHMHSGLHSRSRRPCKRPIQKGQHLLKGSQQWNLAPDS